MAQELYLPTLSHWEYGNEWSGERGQARFFITPSEGQMTVELWRGPFCREFSQVLVTGEFPVSQEGLDQMSARILEQAQIINASLQ